tara:strand:- start:154 stop:510 length:357 start_codon:yes stop_codon:yes gene_type:complete
MISYSTNWMGPVSTRWYEDRNIPFVLKETLNASNTAYIEYKDYLERYACGRIDIYGLDEEEYWCGKHEYGLAPMRTEDWNAFSDWLDTIKEDYILMTYKELIRQFEDHHGKAIRWYKD